MDNDRKHSIFEMYDCMFNLNKFADYEASLDKKSKWKLLLRLTLYSFVLSIWTVLIIGFLISYISNAPFSSNSVDNFIVSFFTAIVMIIPFGIILSLIILASFKYGGGIGGGLALGIALAAIIGVDSFAFSTTPPTGVPGAMAMGIVSGVESGIIFSILALFFGFNRGISVGINIGTIFGIIAGVAGIIWGVFGIGISVGIIFGIAFGISLSTVHKFISNTDFGVGNCILFSIIGGVFTSFVISIDGGIAESISFFIFYSGFSDIFPRLIQYVRAKYSNYPSNENNTKSGKSSVKDILNKTSQNIYVIHERYSHEAPVSQKSFIRHICTVISQNQLLSGLVVAIIALILQKMFL